MESIGFIGTGRMGGGMSARILSAGYPLTVFDSNPQATAPLIARGAKLAQNPREVADRAAIVFACLPSQEISRTVARDVAAGSAVNLYVETSTIGTGTIDAVAKILAGTSIGLIDAPISGGPRGAEAGTLSTVVAGKRDDLDRVRPIVESFTEHIFYVGETPGQAQIAKLVNNLLSLAGRAITFEGMAMGMRAGLDPMRLAEFINVSTGRNLATQDDFPSRLLHLFHADGGKSIGIKDMKLYLEESERLGVPVWTSPKVLELFLEGAEYGADDTSGLRLSDYVQTLRKAVAQ